MKGKNKGMAARVMEENTHVFVPCGENMLNLTMADFAKESIQNKSLCGVVQKLFFFSLVSLPLKCWEMQVERTKEKNTDTPLYLVLEWDKVRKVWYIMLPEL